MFLCCCDATAFQKLLTKLHGTVKTNALVDRLTPRLRHDILENELDPMLMPELNTEVLGNIVSLSEGSLRGLSTIHRSGNSLLSTGDTEWVTVSAGLRFTRLAASYTLSVEPAGAEMTAEIQLCETEAEFQLSISATTLQTRLDRLKITDMGEVTVDTKDFSLGFLLDPLINSVIKLLKTQIAAIVSKALFLTMSAALAEIDLNATLNSIE